MRQEKNKELDFSNQKFFIGIDVHKKNWKVTIRSQQIELKTFSMNPIPKELVEHLRKNYPNGTYYSCYEAGFCGYWIDQELNNSNVNNIVINPGDVPTTNKEKLNKTDKIDSRKLARQLENKNLRGIYIPSTYQQELRSLSRLRHSLTKDQARIKNRIKGHLLFYGKKTVSESRYWSGRYISELRNLEFSYSLGKEYLDIYLDELERIRKKISQVVSILRKISRDNKEAKVINLLTRSVPGIGFTTAITMYSEIMDMKRFSTIEKLASYVGLVPSLNSSGEKERTRGITVRKSKYLRPLMIEAAWIAVKRDPSLFEYFSKLTRRMNKKRAIISVARKLLNRIRYVWLNETDYICGYLN
jgi:transposase